MVSVFLIGGGWQTDTFAQTYGRFLDAATQNGVKRIAIVVAEEEGTDARENFQRFRYAFESIGLNSTEAFSLVVSAAEPLTFENLSALQPTGIFVCGGLTPAYYEALCRDYSWLEYLTAGKIPYAGFSAGAAIAARQAIVGGWRRETSAKSVEIVNENASEDLDFLDVRKGLGLVSFAVDAHATQWGTLTRLVHAIDAGLVTEGWAIDENTMLAIENRNIFVGGAGNAYRVRRDAAHSRIEIFQAGASIFANE